MYCKYNHWESGGMNSMQTYTFLFNRTKNDEQHRPLVVVWFAYYPPHENWNSLHLDIDSFDYQMQTCIWLKYSQEAIQILVTFKVPGMNWMLDAVWSMCNLVSSVQMGGTFPFCVGHIKYEYKNAWALSRAPALNQIFLCAVHYINTRTPNTICDRHKNRIINLSL